MKMQRSLHAGSKQAYPARIFLPSKPSCACWARRPRNSASGGAATLDPEKSAKEQALERLLNDIATKHGKGAVMRQGDKPLESIQRFGSGCLSLDVALGGGYPRGRVVEIFGPESCGKTTLALHAIAEVQKMGEKALMVDVEQALDSQHAQRIGVDMVSLLVSQPGCGEDALDIVDMAACSGTVALIVVDSVSALLPRAELEGDVGQTGVANQARLMSQAMRKLIGSANKGSCTIIFINQIRNKVGVMFGNPETTSGGQALKYYASIRIDLRKKETIKAGDEAIGIKVKAKMIKNKVAAPFREVIFDIIFTRGIDTVGALVDAAETLDVITRKGAWYYLGEKRLGQGRDKAMEAIRQDPVLLKEVQDASQAALAATPDAALIIGGVDGDEGELEDPLEGLEPAEGEE